MIIKPEWMNDRTVYSPNDIDMICSKVIHEIKYTKKGKIKYVNAPFSFDTETTSFYDEHGEKTAIVYVWMLGICGMVIVGRTMQEWLYVYNRLCANFHTCGKQMLIIYIHNMGFDFQFIRKYHNFTRVFAMEKYEPLYAQTDEGIEFRCSLKLSGYRLETIGDKILQYHKMRKLVGELDYRENRHYKTPLTDAELQYCINDAKIVCAYIDESIEQEGGSIANLPLTKTGYVRKLCRTECFNAYGYKDLIRNMKLTSDEFKLCKSAFCGGYTHASSEYVNETLSNVVSLDIASSYPSVLVAEKYPIDSPKHIDIKDRITFNYYLNNYCCVFTITLYNVRPRYWYDFYLSASKCDIHGKRTIANGRIVKADKLTTTITNVDYDLIRYMYEYDEIEIPDFIYFKREYLPTPFIRALLSLYQQKTELKGIDGRESEYEVIKGMLNSFYGMTVTSPVRSLHPYDSEWLPQIEPELENAIRIYNNNYNRFLFYPWGIFCTAYARKNIWRAIIECGKDHVYSDTDSEKCLNFESHKTWFDAYNLEVQEKHKRACKIHGIDFAMCHPKTITGKEKPLGVFEYEGTYDKFKTLGAKRYLYLQGDKYGLTVAGLSKKSGLEYLRRTYKTPNAIFEAFTDGLIVPPEYSGRLIHTYIDERRTGLLKDMYGNIAHYDSMSSVHLEPASYSLGMQDFLNYIHRYKEGDFYG